MLKYLEKENFDDEVKEGEVLVDFFATWCGPCQMLGPVLEDFASNRDGVKVIKVDVDKHEDLARKFGIMSVPTLMVYKNGQVVKQESGFVPKEVIDSWYK